MNNIIKLSLLVVLASVTCFYFYPDLQEKVNNFVFNLIVNWQKAPDKKEASSCLKDGEKLFTSQELLKYDGSANSLGIYLAFLGVVYDVSRGAQHYKPGGSYSFFAGKDATRAYLTGQFTEDGLVDSLKELDLDSFGGVQTWVDLYESDYKRIGKVVGSYYDSSGCPKEELDWVQKRIQEYNAKQSEEADESRIFPYCNSEWNQELASGRVWCSKRSGGFERDWVGVPRQLFDPDKKNHRCACVKNFGPPSTSSIEYVGEEKQEKSGKEADDVGDLNNPRLIEYEGCEPTAFECKLKK